MFRKAGGQERWGSKTVDQSRFLGKISATLPGRATQTKRALNVD